MALQKRKTTPLKEGIELMKRPWEIYLDLLIFGGWRCSFFFESDYASETDLIIATALKGRIQLKAKGSTLREAVEKLAVQILN